MNVLQVIAELQAKASELDFEEKWQLAELHADARAGPLRDTQLRDLKEIADSHWVPCT